MFKCSSLILLSIYCMFPMYLLKYMYFWGYCHESKLIETKYHKIALETEGLRWTQAHIREILELAGKVMTKSPNSCEKKKDKVVNRLG